jgi:RNA polymerase sigma-70 factor (ECF subfamily)
MLEQNEDAAWVARCLKGDSSAFEPLVTRYQRVVFTLALRLLGNYEDAKDATQNAFIRAYEKLDTYNPAHRFFSWMYRIGVNESLNLRRARKEHESLAPTLESADRTGDAVEVRELSERVQAALMELSKEYREVVVMRHFGELSYQEIGEALDIPEKTVKSRLFSARQRLGQLLAADGGDYGWIRTG